MSRVTIGRKIWPSRWLSIKFWTGALRDANVVVSAVCTSHNRTEWIHGGFQWYVLIALIAITYSKFRVQSARRKPRDLR